MPPTARLAGQGFSRKLERSRTTGFYFRNTLQIKELTPGYVHCPGVVASRHGRPGSRGGFTLVELVFVLAMSAILMTIVVNVFSRYTRERAAQQAAYLLSRDLRLARARAIGSRQPVARVVEPAARAYVIRDQRGTVIARRTFAAGSDLMIESITLGLDGDSVVFSAQGVAIAMPGAVGGVAEAVVGSPTRDYVVRFNATGSSRIVER